jgi:ribosomal protein L12E/L44/L45/RPP1/RPP2
VSSRTARATQRNTVSKNKNKNKNKRKEKRKKKKEEEEEKRHDLIHLLRLTTLMCGTKGLAGCKDTPF